jgi:alpha-tubulin suppressor-like RCC1 family protein
MRALVPAVVSAALGLAACEKLPGDAELTQPPSGGVELALTMIPSGIQCVKVTVTVGSQTVSPPLLTVTAGASSASLNLGQLPAGNATFNGTAFNVACSAVTSSTVANWIADPTTAPLMSGVVTQVALTFRRNNPVTVSANFLDNIAELAVGVSASYARMSDGTVKEWGNAGDGLFSQVPAPVPGLTNVVQIAAGDDFACARKTDGTVACWGASGPFGKLGPNVALNGATGTPVLVPLPDKATDLAAGQDHACAVLTRQNVMCWGRNQEGQLGSGNTTSGPTPVTVQAAGERVFAGKLHTCIIESGHVGCFGDNSSGQLGTGTTTNSSVPVFINGMGVNATTEMNLGFAQTCALRADGAVHCWGNNSEGQLGDGSQLSRLSPVAVTGLTDAVQIAGPTATNCARKQDKTVVCWGSGQLGNIGDGAGELRMTPTLVPGLTNVVAIRGHLGSHACVELADRTARCWGVNDVGQLGDGTRVSEPRPTPVKLQ